MQRIVTGLATALLIGFPATSFAEQHSQPTSPGLRSATQARDIGGFALGMHVRDAAKLAKLEEIGGGQFDAEYEGRKINFEVTPLGRIFRVQSSQALGRFVVNDAFAAMVLSKLSAKYGPPQSRELGSYGWQITEPVKHANGRILPFTTMWMSAFISGGHGVSDVSLEIKLIDFRILWQDQAKLQLAPRDAAEKAIAF